MCFGYVDRRQIYDLARQDFGWGSGHEVKNRIILDGRL